MKSLVFLRKNKVFYRLRKHPRWAKIAKSLVFLRKNKVLEGFREGQDSEKLGFPKENEWIFEWIFGVESWIVFKI